MCDLPHWTFYLLNMPEKILALLEKGNYTEWQISEKLNISVAEVTACMDYLKHIGLIKSFIINPQKKSCSGTCGTCSTSCNHISNSSYKVWELV